MCVARSRAPSLYERAVLSRRQVQASARIQRKNQGQAERCWEGCFKLGALRKRNKRRWISGSAPRKNWLVCLYTLAMLLLPGLLLAYARADVRQQSSHSQRSFCAASSPQQESRGERVRRAVERTTEPCEAQPTRRARATKTSKTWAKEAPSSP